MQTKRKEKARSKPRAVSEPSLNPRLHLHLPSHPYHAMPYHQPSTQHSKSNKPNQPNQTNPQPVNVTPFILPSSTSATCCCSSPTSSAAAAHIVQIRPSPPRHWVCPLSRGLWVFLLFAFLSGAGPGAVRSVTPWGGGGSGRGAGRWRERKSESMSGVGGGGGTRKTSLAAARGKQRRRWRRRRL